MSELKGRQPALRGSSTVAVGTGSLRNPLATPHLVSQSSGSSGSPTRVPLDLGQIRSKAVTALLALEARGGSQWVKILWIPRGTGARERLLHLSCFGEPVARWFSPLYPAISTPSWRSRWFDDAMRRLSKLAGVPLPAPDYVRIEDPLPIARWMAEILRSGRVPFLWLTASYGALLCQAAADAGVDLRGAQIQVSGEATTAARLAAIRRSGAQAWPSYGSTESGYLASACLAPEEPDELHLYSDLNEVIQPGPGPRPSGLPPGTLLLSSLRPTAPLVLVNASLGDQAVMTERRCGCPMERLGWTTHIHTIRSSEKLTAGGLPMLDWDVVRVLEEVLPAQFGGAPTDYQLAEDETDDGRPRIRLLVHPSVGPVDHEAVAETFLTAISSRGESRAASLWRQRGMVKVERRAPMATKSGKILHLMSERHVLPS